MATGELWSLDFSEILLSKRGRNRSQGENFITPLWLFFIQLQESAAAKSAFSLRVSRWPHGLAKMNKDGRLASYAIFRDRSAVRSCQTFLTRYCSKIVPLLMTSDNTLGGQIPVRTNLGDFGSTPRSSSDKNGGSDRAHLDPVRTKITGLSRLRDLLGHKTGTKLGVNAFRTKSCADLHLKEHENDSRNEIFAWWPSKFPFLEAYGIIG
ncbi:hypothetical protein B0H12DRAFT_1263074 [Mycena haematopus]|nr:hypothetical protein B0H12DRAFT_1263074 [Mycena haematopus]